MFVKAGFEPWFDMSLCYYVMTLYTIILLLQHDLRSLEKWESDWCMEFNASKCNVIRVTRRRTRFIFQCKRHGKVLESVDTIKYLGINLA